MSTPDMSEFRRIKRLPPYVFGIVNELKAAARARGEDIVDFGMGNPDQPTPQHIVDKLVEAAQRGDTHRYSVSRGIPRLRKAICDWYRRRYDVDLDPETQAIVTIGSKEGLAHLALACVGPGDTVLVPNPTYPIHPYGFIIAGADVRHVPMQTDAGFLAELEQAIQTCWPRPKMLVLSFPSNPTAHCVDLAFFERVIEIAKENNIWVIHDLAYADIVFDGHQVPSILQVPGAEEIAVEWKLWLDLPELGAISLVNAGAEGTLRLPAGYAFEHGPVSLFPVTEGLPRGTGTIGCRQVDPTTGATKFVHTRSFEIQ